MLIFLRYFYSIVFLVLIKSRRIKKINKSQFNKNKKPIDINNVDINKTVISKKEMHGKNVFFKYVIGYGHNDDIRP